MTTLRGKNPPRRFRAPNTERQANTWRKAGDPLTQPGFLLRIPEGIVSGLPEGSSP